MYTAGSRAKATFGREAIAQRCRDATARPVHRSPSGRWPPEPRLPSISKRLSPDDRFDLSASPGSATPALLEKHAPLPISEEYRRGGVSATWPRVAPSSFLSRVGRRGSASAG